MTPFLIIFLGLTAVILVYMAVVWWGARSDGEGPPGRGYSGGTDDGLSDGSSDGSSDGGSDGGGD